MSSHITIVETVYHHCDGQSPSAPIESRYSRILKTNEQSYGPRRMTISEVWQPIDTGWLGNKREDLGGETVKVGMLSIHNLEGTQYSVQPSHEERAAMQRRVIEIGFQHDDLIALVHPAILILPGESTRFHPARASQIRVRCRCGQAKLSITAIPE